MGLTGRTFGRLPSELLGVVDPVVAYAVDEAVALRLKFDGERARDAASGKGTIGPDERYETIGDVYASGVN